MSLCFSNFNGMGPLSPFLYNLGTTIQAILSLPIFYEEYWTCTKRRLTVCQIVYHVQYPRVSWADFVHRTGFSQVLESLKSPEIWKKVSRPWKSTEIWQKYPRSLKSPWIFNLICAQLIISSCVEATFLEDARTCDFYTAAICLKLFQILLIFSLQEYTAFQEKWVISKMRQNRIMCASLKIKDKMVLEKQCSVLGRSWKSPWIQ